MTEDQSEGYAYHHKERNVLKNWTTTDYYGCKSLAGYIGRIVWAEYLTPTELDHYGTLS